MHERRRERLGLQKLSYIDENMYFVDGNPKPQGTPEEIMANGQKMYEELSPETKEFFEFMMENELFDVLGRKDKKGRRLYDISSEISRTVYFLPISMEQAEMWML